MHRNPRGGIYLSDDAGATWHLVNSEQRLWGRGWYFGQITVDPTNPDRAYDINTATYMTLDAGKTWVPVKGAPGGDDYHQLWINPKDGNRMVLSSDQGTVVSRRWRKVLEHLVQPAHRADLSRRRRQPLPLLALRRAAGLRRRRRQHLVAHGHAQLPQLGAHLPRRRKQHRRPRPQRRQPPLRQRRSALRSGPEPPRTRSAANFPPPTRTIPTAKPGRSRRSSLSADEALYYSNQFVFRTRDRGTTWQKISPDLARLHPEVPKTLDPVTAKDIDEPMTDRFGVVYTIGPSPLDAKTVWVGTDDGLIHVTRDDGANWNDVTPPAMTAWSKVSQIEAGHFDAETAYASVDRHRIADNHPYIYRTHDGGKTWTNVVNGIPEGAFVNSVKEDTKQKGLLYAATELRVYVSFDDGDQWQPLRLNMPVTSVRDIVVHGDDLAVATYGRGFWVLDQMTALRQIAAKGKEIESAKAYLFTPGETYAIRNGSQNGTPLPHEEPQELNPPAGVLAYYWLKSAPGSPLKLELIDAAGKVTVCQASDTPVKPVDTETINVQAIWEEPTPPPSATAGMHRIALNIAAPRGFGGGGGGRGAAPPPPPVDACHPAGTPAPRAEGNPQRRRGAPVLQSGEYTVKLTVDGQTYTQPVTIKPDPRNLPMNAETPPDGDDDDYL